MLCSRFRFGFFVCALTSNLAVAVPDCRAQEVGEIATYSNRKFGFSLSYPAWRFAPREPLQEEGRVWVSPDGKSRILAGALPNTDGFSLQRYREFVLKQSYPGATINYAPVRDTWFVLSGTRDGMAFYERVTFACGGRLIKSWAMLYPEAEKRLYDRVVEEVARSYRPGEGHCG